MILITTTLIVTTVSIKNVIITTLGLSTLPIIHKNVTLSTSIPICWVPLCQVSFWHKVVAPLSMIISVQAPPIHEKWGKSEKCKSKSKILAAFAKVIFFLPKLNFHFVCPESAKRRPVWRRAGQRRKHQGVVAGRIHDGSSQSQGKCGRRVEP
jgi:hypothetical protein